MPRQPDDADGGSEKVAGDDAVVGAACDADHDGDLGMAHCDDGPRAAVGDGTSAAAARCFHDFLRHH